MSYSANSSYRHGRTVATGDRGGPGGGGGGGGVGICATLGRIILFVVALVTVPCALIFVERGRHGTEAAFAEVADTVVSLNAACKGVTSLKRCLLDQPDNRPVHLTTHGEAFTLNATVSDAVFDVRVTGLKLCRTTEYCQWQESSSETCETCTRSTPGGNSTTYPCNCKRTYSYVKAWRPHLVNSFLFDQPAAHHNPQRVGCPSQSFVANDAVVGDAALDPSVLVNAHAELRALSGSYRRLEWTPHAIPGPRPWYTSLPVLSALAPRVRTEDLADLLRFPGSAAATRERFVYVGQGGYFFSPHAASDFEKLAKVAGQYFEGSLFDYQVGDVVAALTGSCAAGDIRVSFSVHAPSVISIVAGVTKRRSNGFFGGVDAAASAAAFTPFVTSQGRPLALAHEGDVPPRAMFAAEERRALFWTYLCRALLVPWGYLAVTALAYGICDGGDRFTWPWQAVAAIGAATAVAAAVAAAATDHMGVYSLTTAVVGVGMCGYSMTRCVAPHNGRVGVWTRLYRWFSGTRTYNVDNKTE